ncbi:DUF748 domain-containing protein [Chitinivorax sp. PXF-14]|uniref:DUF748 domain-containing protein n=1 Tax=Chitinivorax sp. PXF-14 TaxID=3230488 RepID=UPI0034674540
MKNKWLKRTALTGAGIVVVLGAAGLALPPLLKDRVAQLAGEKLQRKVSIDGLSINPYLFKATLSGVSIVDSDGLPLLRFDSLLLDLELASIWQRGAVLREIRLDHPQLRLVRTGANRYNISDIVERFLKEPSPPEKPRFSLNNIQLLDGRIDFIDQPEQQTHRIEALTLKLPFVSSLPYYTDTAVEPGLAARIDGAVFDLKGRAKPFKTTLDSTLALDLDGLDLTRWVDYLPLKLGFKLQQALLDSRLTVAFSKPAQGEPAVTLGGSVSVRKLRLAELDDSPLLAWKAATLTLGELQPLAGKLRFTRLALEAPELHVRRGKDGALNLLKLLPAGDGKPAAGSTEPAKAEARAATQFALGEIALRGGVLHWNDAVPGEGFETTLHDLDLTLAGLALPASHPAKLVISARSERGERLHHEGELTASPFTAQGKVELDGAVLPAYAPYLPAGLQLTGGQLDLAGEYRFSPDNFTLSEVKASLADFKLGLKGEKSPALTIPRLTLAGLALDTRERRLDLAELASDDGRLALSRDARGRLNWLAALPQEQAGAGPAGKPWAVRMAALRLAGYGIDWQDKSPSQAVRLAVSKLDAKLEQLSTVPGEQGKVDISLALGKRGTLAVKGSLTPAPFAADLALNARNLDIVGVQPYFAEHLNIALTRGQLNARGQLALKQAAPFEAGYRGNLAVTGFQAVDKLNAADFLSWKSLYVGNIRAQSQPLKLDVGEVALSDFFSRLIVNANGRLNLQDIVVHEGGAVSTTEPRAADAAPAEPAAAAATAQATAPVATAKAELPPISVAKVTLAGGNIQFSDYFIKPNYSANLTQIGGTVSGLSSNAATRATLALAGSVDNHAPVEIKGSLNPLAKDLFLDIKGGVKGFEMPTTSPYSGKYVGYAIERGKLTMDVSYHVENGELKAENALFLDQLAFGDKIDSPEAVSLPVKLAVALLTDRKGQINVRLPISGTLNDPQFSVGGIIWQVIKNLFEKAVTSPFSLLGSAFGGGEDMAFVEFQPGLAELSPAARDKLDKLGQAMTDKPAIRMDVAGRVDADNDLVGLRRAKLQEMVRAQKLKARLADGQAADEATLTVSEAEYPVYLKAAYKQESFPKPRNLIGLPKDLPVAEMEKLMLANLSLTAEDLRLLANRRAQLVKDYLLKSARLGEDRVFLIAPHLDGKDKDGSGPASRADFTLRQ